MNKSLFIYDLPRGKFKDGEEEKVVRFIKSKGFTVYGLLNVLCIWLRDGTYGYMHTVRAGYDSQIDMYERRFDMPKDTEKVSFHDIVKPKTLEEVLYGT